LLSPVGKDYLWGGTRLNDDFSKGLQMYPLAESWECSVHPDGVSLVASGSHKGELLSEVLKAHPEYLGTHPALTNGGELPILIKLIDANKDLSIQVHPSDDYAKEYEHGALGKTEMWYVLDAEKDASLVYGFSSDISEEQLLDSLETGTIEKYLQKVPVHKDDVFFIEPGTVHALGAGALVVEIQENSNITYRLHDYNRIDKNGKKRELHIDKAIEVLRLESSASPRQPMRVLRYRKGYATELLCRCKYFQVERMMMNTERHREMADLQTGSNSFEVLLCTEGCGTLFAESGEFIHFFRGDCIFVPANSEALKLHGKAQLLKVSC
jgi:mannose-6-phosphate isomerase